MKVTSVELVPAGSSDICEMSFRDPRRQNPFNVKQIAGLDADEIVARYYGTSGSSITGFFNLYDLALEKREIVARIELNPEFSENESYSDLRDRLYKMISSSRTGIIWLNFKNEDESVAAISGFVSKFEAALFSKVPEVQITINCSDPMLKSPNPVSIDVEALEITEIVEDTSMIVLQDPLSTAPHGFTFELEITEVSDFFTITDVDLIWGFAITPDGGFLVGDVLHFSSEFNNKYLYLTRGSSTIHLADKLSSTSVWPILFPGNNQFYFRYSSRVVWNAITHYPTYWGV